MLEEHYRYTQSTKAASILNDFEHVADKVIKVIPKDYELMMQKLNYKVVICHNLMMLNWQHSMMNARQLNKNYSQQLFIKERRGLLWVSLKDLGNMKSNHYLNCL